MQYLSVVGCPKRLSAFALLWFAAACGTESQPEEGSSSTGVAEGSSEASSSSSTSIDGSSTEPDDGSSSTSGEPACAGAWEAGFAIEMPELPQGDPAAGYEALVTRNYVSCGIPWNLFAIAEGVLGVEEPLPGRTGKNAQVGHAWNVVTLEDESELVVSNCLQCHAGRINGELVVGLGKADIDNTTQLRDVLEPLSELPETTEANIAFNKFKSRISTLGPTVVMASVGVNPAVMYAISLLAHRDPETLAWSDEPLFELLEDRNIPADPPPWWRAKKKATHFANGMSRGDHRGTMILASSLCTDTVDEVDDMLGYFADIQAYLATIEPPPYPFEIDAALAEEGRELFDCRCAGCHGTYDEDPSAETFPNLIIPTAVIGTDPAFADMAAPGGAYNLLEDRFNESVYGSVTHVATSDPAPGYTAPPLDGIWATAPFFHNGSVPTIELVLDSTARPQYWRRQDFDSTHYDDRALGWPWTPSDIGHADAADSDRKFIYDTTVFGYGNGGHTYGDAFTPQERAAVIEYLKTI